MKKFIYSVLVVLSVFIYSNFAAADTMSYFESNTTGAWVASDSGTPAYWVKLGFPDATTGTYLGGTFEYDNYVGNVQSLFVTLKGNQDNSTSPVDMYLSFNATHATYSKIGAYNVPEYQTFNLTADIKNNLLLLNGNIVGALSNVNLNSFLNTDFVWVGYGCSFYQTETDVSVSVGGPGSPVPEPSTMLLLGFGLIGLGGFSRTLRKS